jgi:allantoin racemase
MYQAHAHLAENLPVPVLNPGPLTYKLAELMLGLRLTQSRAAYPQPEAPKLEMAHAMMDGAAQAAAAVV